MHIVLKAVSYQQRQLPTAIVVRFGPAGGTIGRDEHRAMVLPDPDRYISRNQADVCLQDQGFVIRNTSASNGIKVGDRWLDQGECAQLKPGLKVLVGDYELDVEGDTTAGEPAALWPTHAAHQQGRASRPWPEAPVASHAGLCPPVAAGIGVACGSLDALLAGGTSGGDHATGLAPLLDPGPLRRPLDSWKLAAPAPAPAAWPQPIPDDQLPAQSATVQVPLIASPAPATATAAVEDTPASAPAGRSTEAELWVAFCEGAALKLSLEAGSGPARLRAVGQVLRSAISGTLDLLEMRTEFKKELRGDVTTFVHRGNNPLKFSVGPEHAMEQLVQATSVGYLAGPEAMGAAMHDLKTHAAGTMAGLQAALFGLLEQLDPEAHEAVEPMHPVLDTLLPWRRRARLWERSRQAHDRLCKRVEEDFHGAVGPSMMRAYAEQTAQRFDDTIP